MNTRVTDLKRGDFFNKLSKRYIFRIIMLLVLDIIGVIFAISISINLTAKNNIELELVVVCSYLIFNTIAFIIYKCYSTLWRYAGEEEIISIFGACLSYTIPIYILHLFTGINLPILFYVVSTVFIITFTCGIRLLYRYIRRFIGRADTNKGISRVLIIGAGCAGEMVIQELKRNPALGKTAVAIIDDDKNKIGRSIHHIKIVGTSYQIEEIVKLYDVDEIIFSIANISKENKKTIMDTCKNTKCKIKTIPGIYEIIDGKVNIQQIRNVQIEDLLGREQVNVDLKEISEYIENKVVLVTGGGGSIGSELCRQISSFKPKELIIVDNYENNAYSIQQELIMKNGNDLNLKIIIASVREPKRIEEIFKTYSPQVVFHAAAHKHVPLMEFSKSEAIKNNIFGTLNVSKMASKYKANKFVLISTDKAVNPTNIMGATKRAAEMIIQTMNEESDTEFVAVRFGNVLGSNGSVIPLFKKQIEEGGPVTVTHPDVIRYFMTIQEAVGLVIQAGAMAKGGEIFVLDMGEQVKIIDLAKNLIRLSGFEPGIDIKIKITGLRPGEKLYEELLMEEEGLLDTKHEKIFIGQPLQVDKIKMEQGINDLKLAVEKEDIESIENIMRNLITTYRRPEYVNSKFKK